MIVEKEIKKMVMDLSKKNHAELELSGFTITVETYEQHSWVSVSTTVYFGGDYIPPSVRKSVSDHPAFTRGAIEAELRIYEESFQIKLSYLGRLDGLDCPHFFQMIEDFRWLAEKWRDYLDERDKNDLVYIHHKR